MKHHTPKQLVFQAAVRQYLDAGLTLVPLHKWDAPDGKGKTPRDRQWTTRPYVSAAVLAECLKAGINIGARPGSGFVIFDCDPRHGGDASFATFCLDHDLDADTLPQVLTGGGGFHYFARLPKGAPKLRKKIKDYPGLDILSGDGMQAVCAGSRHPSGKFYEWDEISGRPDLKDAPHLSAAIVAVLARPSVEDMEADAPDLEAVAPEIIAEVLSHLDATDFRDHDTWQTFMVATVAASGGEAMAEFIAFSTSDPLYTDDDEKIKKRWESFAAEKPGGITGRTFYYMAREHGAPAAVLGKLMPRTTAAEDFAGDDDDFVDGDADAVDDGEFDGPESRTAAAVAGIRTQGNNSIAPDSFDNAVAAVLECGFQPQYNLLSQKVEFRAGRMPHSITHGGELTDNVVRVMRDHFVRAFQGNQYNPSKENVREAVMTIALRNRFNPLLDYLDSLKWDGVERLSGLFPDYFHCEDSDYARAVSICFAIGAVRRVRRPGSKFDTMPVVKGPQGWNKSSGVRALFGADYYTDAAINIRDKDASLITRGIWVLEVAELDGMRRQEATAFKAWLARAVDRQRDPYGSIVEDFPRSWVCIGTTNEGAYLKDATGARRFWPLTITKPVDVKRLTADRDQLWAEAAAREARGESDILPRKLWAVAGEHQERETSEDPWRDTLQNFIIERARDAAKKDRDDFDAAPPPPDRVLSSELYDALRIDEGRRTREQGQRMRVVMEGLGWTYKMGVRVLEKSNTGFVREKAET